MSFNYLFVPVNDNRAVSNTRATVMPYDSVITQATDFAGNSVLSGSPCKSDATRCEWNGSTWAEIKEIVQS